MSSWIRKPEYQHIKMELEANEDVKTIAHHYDRAIGTIYNIKNTKDHKDYCEQYNQRQYEAEYKEHPNPLGVLPKSFGKWVVDKEGNKPPSKFENHTQLDRIEEKLDRLSRQLNALEYIWEK